MPRRHLLAVLALASAATCGCRREPASVKPAPPPPFAITFTDVTGPSGIRFTHNSGAFGRKWLPETMGSGVIVLDYDGDGWQDLYFVNARDWTAAECAQGKPATGPGPQHHTTGHLYRNRHDDVFEDVTARAGLSVEMYGMGGCAGDFDNDGHVDLYLTGWGGNHLFRNRGNGTFEDVTARAGVGDSGWSTSAAFVDYDRDGNLDLFVCHYVRWSPATDIECKVDGTHKDYCRPNDYTGEPCRLYHNDGHGRFTDVSQSAGIWRGGHDKQLQGKSLGVAICDYNDDGWPDIAVANDTEPNYLFENQKNGKFEEVGVPTGMAFDDSGTARGAMGIDACDFNHCGRESLLIGNFSNQMVALYQNHGSAFVDTAGPMGVGQPSLLFLVFGSFFFDADNDGWPDIFTANGHVEDDIEKIQSTVKREERPLFYRNLGGERFEEVGLRAGPAMQRPILARGAAHLDFDLDGDQDVVISTNRGPAYLLRNEGGSKNGSVRVELQGTRSNRSGIGALVLATVGSDHRRFAVRSGSSYCSQSELAVSIGLGRAARVDSLEVRWPSGQVDRLSAVKANQIVTVREGQGIVGARPFPRAWPRLASGSPR
jgi:hypothetical protein